MEQKKDYCSSSPDSLFGFDISTACAKHDNYYYNHSITRKEADIQLREDINKVLPKYLHFIGWIYYFSVRIFGKTYW